MSDGPKTPAEALRNARTAVIRKAFGDPDNCNDQTFPPLVDAPSVEANANG